MSVSNNELGELLIDLGLISPEQLSDAIVQQQNSGTRLTVVLSDMGLITERQLKDALELQYGVNFVNLSSAPPESEYVRLVPEEIERKFRFVPVSMQGNQFTVAMVDPDDLVAAEAIREHLSSTNFKKLVCTADDFEHLMYMTYEAPPESQQENSAETVDETDFSSASPRASQTKLKAHMRNLFESDSDDDLDSMFGKSSDNLPALKESDIMPAKETKKKTKKAISKKITSLFDDDDDDDFGDDDLDSAAQLDAQNSPETAQEAEVANVPSEALDFDEAHIAEDRLRSRPELTAEIENDSLPKDEAMPSNQLLEHILQEAGVPKSKPTKMKPKKKSMQSLFDDDDDDMDFDSQTVESSSEETRYSEPQEDSYGGSLTGEASYTGGSLTGEDSYTGGLLSSLESLQEEVPTDELGSNNSFEEEPAEQPKKSAASKAFRSLFDDEMDEDDLFGNDGENESVEPSQNDESLEQIEAEHSEPDMVADVNTPYQPRVAAEPKSEQEYISDPPDSAQEVVEQSEESAESLMSAIERPFQSLFDDDEDEDDLFSGSSQADSENKLEVFAGEDGHFASDEALMPVEPSGGEELRGEEEVAAQSPPQAELAAEQEAPTALEEDEIKPAYHASFDDEMDEDSLFASASHPIPEGAPHLRDLLSRFDDSDAAFDALEDSLSKSPSEVVESTLAPQAADEEDAELAVSALIAALDEQVPDEEISIPPRTNPTEEDSIESQNRGVDEGGADGAVGINVESFDSQHEGAIEHVASLPEVSQEVPAISSPIKKTATNPKSKKLRAMMMDDDDDFGLPDSDDTTSGAELEAETDARTELGEVLPLDQEDLMPISNATSELPPVIVSRSARTMTPGNPLKDEVSAPAVSSFDDEIESGQPAEPSSLEETLPPPSASRQNQETLRAQLEVNTSVPLPATAAELPDALDDVLSSVTNDLIDNVELANLSGNRTEISFLEEIVESELALDDQTSRESELDSDAPNEIPPASDANSGVIEQVEQAPEVQAAPAVQASAPAAAVQEAPDRHEVQQAPTVQPVAAVQAPAPTPTAQTAPQSVPASKDLSVSQASVEKLNLDPSILNLATQILTQAVNSPCSDVHFEPLADGLALRFMSDGDLLDETILPAQIQGMLILCLKSMAGLDPSVSDRPQDKRFITSSFGDPVEMRITSIPGMHGEMVAVSLKS